MNKKILVVTILITVIMVSIFIENFIKKQDSPHFSQIENVSARAEIQAKRCALSRSGLETNILGISAHIDEDERFYQELKNLGVNWARIDFNWRWIEPQKGMYDWTFYDRAVGYFRKHDIQVLGIINHMPDWIESNEEFEASLERFASALIARYKENGTLAKQNDWGSSYGVRHWEIFNEPNLAGYGWVREGGDPAKAIDEYVLALAVSNRAVRAIDPYAVILNAGLSPGGYPPPLFVQKMYELGAKNCFDAFAFHPYGSQGQFYELVGAIRAELQKYGDGQKPVWFTEYGHESANDAERIEILESVWNERSAADALFWFSLRDIGTRKGDQYGLIDYEWNRKPSYYRFQELNKNE
jgi:hypothetical protein